MIKVIKSNRAFEEGPSWDIVHEWEDSFNLNYSIPIFSENLIIKLLKLIPNLKLKHKLCDFYFLSLNLNKPALVFHLFPSKSKKKISSNDIPVIIDFSANEDLNLLNEVYSKCKVVYVTSKEVYQFLLGKVKFTLKYIPLTLPDKYFLGAHGVDVNKNLIIEKDIDIIELGRPNKILNGWLKEFIQKNPSVHYVYRIVEGNKFRIYSNKFGLISESNSREGYFKLLKRTKVSLYSSPGIDDGKMGGFNPLTPRLLEMLSQFNYVLARYSENIEFNEIKGHIPNCNSYSEFEFHLKKSLLSFDMDFFNWTNLFLENRLTSKIVF